MIQRKKVLIIGAGIAGLSSAVRMASRGHEVHVFEASDRVGGKLHEFFLGEYRFDAGPSLFTMPQYVTDLFSLSGLNSEDYFEYQKLDTICNYFWEDGTICSTFSDQDKTISEISNCLNEDPLKIKDHFENSKLKYQLTGKTFLENSLHKWSTWLTKDVFKALLKLHKLDLFKSMHQANLTQFRNKKTIQLFDRYATYNGSNPYKAPGLLNIIPHFEYGFGAFLPAKGMNDISDSVFKLGQKLGVNYHFNTKVEKIKKHKDRILSLYTENGKEMSGDIFITNMDAYFTYLKLLEEKDEAEKILKQERSSSALIFYWGVKKSFPELDLHNIFFADDYQYEFDQIAEGKISSDPTVYINITSKFVENDAPKGRENWFTMINVPYNKGQNWDELIDKSRINIINKVSRILGINIKEFIECEEILDPRSIESKTISYTGSLYGTSSNSRFAAFARHPNKSPKYNNLYFTGGSVHPGGGVPLCLLSSKIVDELIHE